MLVDWLAFTATLAVTFLVVVRVMAKRGARPARPVKRDAATRPAVGAPS